MKRIAIAADKDVVSGHFGLCDDFMYYNTDGERITKIERFPNPGHRPCELPEKVIEQGLDTIISGKMGKAAAEIFAKKGVEIIIGAEGETREIVDAYIHDGLQSKGEFCDAWACEFFA